MLEELLLKINKITIKDDGISLIEVAIGLVILGLIVTPLMQAHKVGVIQESKTITRGALSNVEDSINQYYSSGNGAYPCPASLILAENSANFGESGDCIPANFANIKLCTNILWRTTEGICKTSNNVSTAVIIGGFPFATLKTQQENALDYWGNKVIYAVTFEQTDNTTFTANVGQIRVNAVDNPKAVKDGLEDGVPEEKTNTIDFFLFSTGALGAGGFTKNGIATATPCVGAIASRESENCNFDDRFFYDIDPDDDTASAFSGVAGINFYDDITRAQDSVPEATWFQHPDNASYTGDFVMTLSTRVGIGTPIPNETIEVVGDIRTNGRLQSDQICDINGNNCLDPELITGTMDQMECDASGLYPGNQAVTRLEGSQVHCNSAEDKTNSNTAIDGDLISVDITVVKINSCPPGDLISGIDPNGDIICVTP